MTFNLQPSIGHHLLCYQNEYFFVERYREDQQALDRTSGKPWEKILFTTLSHNIHLFPELLSEATEKAFKEQIAEAKTTVYTNEGTDWMEIGLPRRRRCLSSVILDERIGDELVEDIKEFMDSRSWYDDYGIPYRRGYLLHGPPGSGKTSFIYALAGYFQYNICLLNLNEAGLTDERLGMLLNTLPSQCIVLMEDVDAAFPESLMASRTTTGTTPASSRLNKRYQMKCQQSQITFSGLLNVLDGITASEDRIIFMTTNYLDQLDAALIRPGRIDRVQYIGPATDYQIKRLFRVFYPTVSEEDANQFVVTLRRYASEISMAKMQGYFLHHKDEVDSAIQNLPNILSFR